MTEQDPIDHITHQHLHAAQTVYRAQGNLFPVIALDNTPTGRWTLTLGPDERFTNYIQMVAAAVAFLTSLQPRYITFAMEAWIKTYNEADAPNHLARGELARLHAEGDTTVRTAIVIHTIDTRDELAATTTTIDNEDGTWDTSYPDTHYTWDDYPETGYVARQLLTGYLVGREGVNISQFTITTLDDPEPLDTLTGILARHLPTATLTHMDELL